MGGTRIGLDSAPRPAPSAPAPGVVAAEVLGPPILASGSPLDVRVANASGEPRPGDRFERRAAWVIGIVALIAFVAFLMLDNTLPHWDSGVHLTEAADFRDAFRAGHLWAPLDTYLYYPPLAHSIVAIGWLVLGSTWRTTIALLAMWPALLFFSARRLGRRLGLGAPARVVLLAVLMGCPFVIGNAREFQLDVPTLALVVTFAVSIRGVERRPASDLADWARPLTIAMIGMLTKWTFVEFAVPIVIAEVLWRRRVRRQGGNRPWVAVARVVPSPRRRRAWVIGAVVSSTVAASWYVIMLGPLLWDFRRFASRAGVIEGDPQGFTLASAGFYCRALVMYYGGLPAMALAGVAIVLAVAAGRRRLPAVGPLWLIAGWMVAIDLPYLIQQGNKDVRYIAPLLLPVALAMAGLVDRIDRIDRNDRNVSSASIAGARLDGAARARMAVGMSVAAVALAVANIVNLTLPIGNASLRVHVLGTDVPIVNNSGYSRLRPSIRYRAIDAAVKRAKVVLTDRQAAATCVGTPAIGTSGVLNHMTFNRGTAAGLVRLYGSEFLYPVFQPCVIVTVQSDAATLTEAVANGPYVVEHRFTDGTSHELAAVLVRTA